MTHWYKKSQAEIFKDLDTEERGLSNAKVNKLLKKYGKNEISEVDPVRWWHILLAQFAEIMVIILIIGAAVSFLLGEYIDATAIIVIVLINAVIGFVQEFKAETAIHALKRLSAPDAVVVREGQTLHIDSKQLVPGDILILEEGMYVPADARVLSSAEMHTLESSLTGESLPVRKHTDAINKDVGVGDMVNMVFMGTVITKGHGTAVVVNTGMRTHFGSIAHMVQKEKPHPTPLQKRLDHISKILAAFILVIIGILFVVSYFSGRDMAEMFIFSISLAVSVIPEGLPAVITLTLAIAVQRMAKKNAIVRKLPAAETLGSTSVICTDKTGTLTQNQMTVQKIFVNKTDVNVTGIGYDPSGSLDGKKSDELNLLIEIGALCNNSRLLKNSTWSIIGDPTEGALLTLAQKAGVDVLDLNKEFARTYENVFDSDRKRMSTVHERGVMYMKGAVDSVLEVCDYIQLEGEVMRLTDELREAVMMKNNEYASEAYRVLGFAYKKVLEDKTPAEADMIFVGMAGMIDPPRTEVARAIKTCNEAHIRVVMITGDHAMTAKAIGQQIGLYNEGEKILTGTDLESMTVDELKTIVEDVRIFARVSPKHKVMILKAIRSHGHVVAMTGDGINDAPALKSADIGISMGITGTDVAQESSDMILTDDNFATIVDSIRNGREILSNIKKFIRFLLSANFDEIVLISLAFAAGLPLPFVPLQILWINLMTDSLPAVALGLDKADDSIMKLKPHGKNSGLIKDILLFTVVAGVFSTLVSILVYLRFIDTHSIEYTRTMVMTTIVIFELMLVFSVRDEYQFCLKNITQNKFLISSVLVSLVLQFAVVYLEPLQRVFETEALKAQDWALIVGGATLAIALIEIWKQFRKAPDHV